LYHSLGRKIVSIAVIAIVAALGVLRVYILLAITTVPVQEAEAVGCPCGATGAKLSKIRCFRG
jgi:hypothetical protein